MGGQIGISGVQKRSPQRRNHKLADARREHSLSQARLAAEIGTTPLSVTRWETGQTSPSQYFLWRLCTYFKKSAQELGFNVRDEDETPSHLLLDPVLPPLPLHRLIGRDALINEVRQDVLASEEGRKIAALNGLPGVGKTTVAVALAHDQQIQKQFDGIFWAGLGPKPDIVSHLKRWGMLLGVIPTELAKLSGLDSWAIALRMVIGTRRMLFIIDDAWHIDDALSLKVGGSNCAHLVTTRSPALAAEFAPARVRVVPALNEDEGVALLIQLASELEKEEDTGAVRTLARSVGGLPLALALMGNHLNTQSSQPRRLSAAIGRLNKAEERLRLTGHRSPLERPPNLAAGTPLSLQAAIAVSVQQLSKQARSALTCLSAFSPKPGPFSEDAALEVVPVEALDELADVGLLEVVGPRQYRLHQTIIDYATLMWDEPSDAYEEP